MRDRRATDETKGRKLLNAVERFVSEPEVLIEQVEAAKAEAAPGPASDPGERRRRIADRIIGQYALGAAVSGGATSLPSLFPGLGPALAATAGAMLDMAVLLKLEVEMTLCLSTLYGFDIRDENERQIAFLMASVSTYENRTGETFFHDLVEAETTAIWNYAPREIARLLIVVMARIAAGSAARGILKAIPLAGVVAGASLNMILTESVGKRVCEELERRRMGRSDLDEQDQEDVVTARED